MNSPKRRGKWNKLKVKIVVSKKVKGGKRVKAGREETARVLLDTLKGRPVASGFKIEKIAWANPGANHYRAVEKPRSDFLYDPVNGLPTLNRGRWLEKMLGDPPPLPTLKIKKPKKGRPKNARRKKSADDTRKLQRPARRKSRKRKA